MKKNRKKAGMVPVRIYDKSLKNEFLKEVSWGKRDHVFNSKYGRQVNIFLLDLAVIAQV